MAKSIVRLTIQIDLNKDSLVDDEVLREKFDKSTEKLIVWILKDEGGWELITFADNPVVTNVEELEAEPE